MEKQALIQLFGTSDIYLIIGGFVWGFLGIILGLILSVNKRNVKSSKSPEHFSWPFFWRDNSVRIVTSILALIAVQEYQSEYLWIQESSILNGGALEHLAEIPRQFHLPSVLPRLS